MKSTKIQLFCLFLVAGMFACKKNDQLTPAADSVDPLIKKKIEQLGFNASQARKVEGGYVVEGDIFLTDENLNEAGHSPRLIIAASEQYRTTNVLTGLPRNITVSISGFAEAVYGQALDEAIARYNAVGLLITFQRVGTGGQIQIINDNNLGAGVLGQSGGFPTSSGNLATAPIRLSSNTIGAGPAMTYLATIIAHEIGHCIGLRHTDYFNRAFSGCLVDASHPADEGQAGVGAINIPGTPTAADPNSFMLACIGAGVNRPFNANDIIALRALYGPPPALPWSFTRIGACNGIYSSYTFTGTPGATVVLKLSFGGYIQWNGMSNGTGASCWVTANGVSGSATTPHYTTTWGTGFSISTTISFTMPAASNTITINTTAVINNSSINTSSAATLELVSVNGVSNGLQQAVCYGNSGGSW